MREIGEIWSVCEILGRILRFESLLSTNNKENQHEKN
jgi:hypothetical protein